MSSWVVNTNIIRPLTLQRLNHIINQLIFLFCTLEHESALKNMSDCAPSAATQRPLIPSVSTSPYSWQILLSNHTFNSSSSIVYRHWKCSEVGVMRKMRDICYITCTVTQRTTHKAWPGPISINYKTLSGEHDTKKNRPKMKFLIPKLPTSNAIFESV